MNFNPIADFDSIDILQRVSPQAAVAELEIAKSNLQAFGLHKGGLFADRYVGRPGGCCLVGAFDVDVNGDSAAIDAAIRCLSAVLNQPCGVVLFSDNPETTLEMVVALIDATIAAVVAS